MPTTSPLTASDDQGATVQRRRVLLTGATGFVGQAVLLALLENADDVDVLAVVRGKSGEDPGVRLAALLDKPAFAAFVRERGSEAARAEFGRRVTAVPGDLSGLDADPAAVAQLRAAGPLDAAVHCASAVSFDLAIDEAFETNVGGALGLYRALLAAGQDPHVVHVSTAYVGGSARGLRTEGPLDARRRLACRARLGAGVPAGRRARVAHRRSR